MHHNDVISKELPTLENFKTINGFIHYPNMEKAYFFHGWYVMVNHRKTTKRPLKNMDGNWEFFPVIITHVST